MVVLYQIFINGVKFLLPVFALFSKKIRVFLQGRKNVFEKLSDARGKINKPLVWVHASSLGEFEQGVPIIEGFKKRGYSVAVSFFSASGYQVKKDSSLCDLVTYLPLDTYENAHKMLNILQPKVVVFVKYEFWYNYLNELNCRKIPVFLVSGIFRRNQIFFKNYGVFFRKMLTLFNHLFVQNELSRQYLENISIKNVSVLGDTRFDRVLEILNRDNTLDFMQKFTQNTPDCLVFGSSWHEDEEVFIPFIQNFVGNMKFVIAPHKIDALKINMLKHTLNAHKTTVLLSEVSEGKNIDDFQVLIVDTVGLLTKIYSYATIAYVGGAMGGTGLHNVLEPAVFGIPVIIGKNYEKFAEAQDLVQLQGVISVSNPKEFETAILGLYPEEKKRIGQINERYIRQKSGATSLFFKYLDLFLSS